MGIVGYERGRAFEAEIAPILRPLVSFFPERVRLEEQVTIHMYDNRERRLDFALDYRTASSNHQVAIECQDREAWSSDIIEKIQAVRNYSRRNRFWYVYRSDAFLTSEAKSALETHGIIHFSRAQLGEHVNALMKDLLAADILQLFLGGGKPVTSTDLDRFSEILETLDNPSSMRGVLGELMKEDYKAPDDPAVMTR